MSNDDERDDDSLDKLDSLLTRGEGDCSQCAGTGEVVCERCGGMGCRRCIDGLLTCGGCDGSGHYHRDVEYDY